MTGPPFFRAGECAFNAARMHLEVHVLVQPVRQLPRRVGGCERTQQGDDRLGQFVPLTRTRGLRQ